MTSPTSESVPNGTDRPVSEQPAGSPPARSQPARRALAMVVAALAIGALINADELSRTAADQPLGGRHDQMVELASTLRHIATPLRLTAPRRLLESLTGRERPDPAMASVGPAEPAAGSTPAAATGTDADRDRPRPPTAERPLRLAVVGDSVMVALGQAIVDRAAATGAVDGDLDARYATGLTRPDRFDWPRRLAAILAEDDPDAVIVLFGANDAQAIATESGSASFGTEAWTAEYRRRVDAVMTLLDTAGRSVYWLGQPVMRDDALRARMDALDEIYRAAAATHPGVRFIDLRPLTAGEDGGYRAYLPGPDGELVAARAEDGVHFNAAGADLVARSIVATIAGDWEPAG